MCLLAVAFRSHPDYPLVLIGNRDEFHGRAALTAHWWRTPELLAGRDLAAGGTWLGMTRNGRIATVTNYREPDRNRDLAPSRGQLVVDALTRDGAIFADSLNRTGSDYNGFNLLWGDSAELWYCHNQGETVPRPLDPGIYGLSNGLLDTPWPKLIHARESLVGIVESSRILRPEPLFRILADRQLPPDHALPDTGIGRDRERLLSTSFILSPQYGTRASTVIIVRRDGMASFHERTFNPDGLMCTDRSFHLQLVH